MFDEVEERLLAPLDVVEQRRRAAPAPRAACGTPSRSPLADVTSSVSPSSERIAAAPPGSDGSDVELLHDLHHRPVGDPGRRTETATANDPSVDRPKRLCNEPRLAEARSPTIVTSSQRCPASARSHASATSSSSAAPDERHVVPPLGRRPAHQATGMPAPARACPSRPAPRPTPHRQRHRRAIASPPRSRPLPVRAPVATATPRSARHPSRGAPRFRSPPRPSRRRCAPRSRARGTRPASRRRPGKPATHRPRAPQAPRTPPPPRPR